MRDRTVRRYGEHALLVRCADQSAVLGLYAELSARPAAGQAELVPADRSLLVACDSPADLPAVEADLATRPGRPTGSRGGALVEIDVRYDGADLEDVGELTGLGAAGVVTAHTGTDWTVAFTGFLPGFGYLIGGDPRLVVPRRSSPRSAVPAGSVALGGGYSGVYPRASPGGWQLVGRTAAPLWDPRREPPALLRPGDTVRFRAVRELPGPRVDAAEPTRASHREDGGAALRVLRAGPLSTVQDLGRPGLRHLGVPGSGAADRSALRRANALVGNPDGTAGIEVTLGGLVVRAVGPLRVAVVGAPGATAAIRVRSARGDRTAALGESLDLDDGDDLSVGTCRGGLRCYLAVAGGVAVPAVLGSRSLDLLTGTGPPALRTGDRVPVGPGSGPAVAPAVAPFGVDERTHRPDALPVLPGPFDGPDRRVAELSDRSWTVSARSNRVGVRLEGHPLPALPETPSVPLVPGAIQLPPSGEPVIFLRDHPTTGGYPVIGVLSPAGIDAAAQLRPGEVVRFAAAGVDG